LHCTHLRFEYVAVFWNHFRNERRVLVRGMPRQPSDARRTRAFMQPSSEWRMVAMGVRYDNAAHRAAGYGGQQRFPMHGHGRARVNHPDLALA
jgi:hypothetical protein